MTELLSDFANTNVMRTNQAGYTSLFEKDFMAFPNRINHDVDERFFQISTATGTRSAQKWNAHQDKSIEKVTYYSPKDQKDPRKVITKVEFEGWRRYVAERRPTEGGRIILHVKGLQKQSALARAIDNQSFRKIGWMEPIVAVTEDPILAVNFREDAIEDDPEYIDKLFARIYQVEILPPEIMVDLKNVIALNSVDRFKKRMLECGFSEYEYQEALKLIRPTALKGVASPFYVSALFCKTKGKFKEARKLLKKISKMHWQFEEAIDFERSLYEQEIRENKQKYEKMVKQLTTEVVHLRSRGSIANQTSAPSADASTTQQSNKTKIQQETEILTPPLGLAKEIIPYFQGLQGLLSRHDQQQNTAEPENAPKTRKRSV